MPINIASRMNDTKVNIILATISAIAENGIEKVSNKIIAEKCGISPASIYYYFKNQHDLLFSVIYYIVEKEAEVLNSVLNCDNSYETNYINMLSAMASYYNANKDILVCYLRFFLVKHNTTDERINMIFNICPLTLFLKKGIKDGEIRSISDSNSAPEIFSIAFYPLCLFLGSHIYKNRTASEESISNFIKGLWAAIKNG